MTSKTWTLSLGRPGVALRSWQGISWRFLGLRVGTGWRREEEGILMDQLVMDQLVMDQLLMLAVSEHSARRGGPVCPFQGAGAIGESRCRGRKRPAS